ncbi:hypothetical protein ACH42_03390 [Endozoicomonas sp. (ex Bugula neritina AB1)]|nr:hypothetical protein ACH42_03390 [Endozoicomonas sp. (ex Bugula neritina AB1)]
MLVALTDWLLIFIKPSAKIPTNRYISMNPLSNSDDRSYSFGAEQSTEKSQPVVAYNRSLEVINKQKKMIPLRAYEDLALLKKITPNVSVFKLKNKVRVIEESFVVGKIIEKKSDEDAIHLFLDNENIAKSFGFFEFKYHKLLLMRLYSQSLDGQLKSDDANKIPFKERLKRSLDVFSGLDYLHNIAQVLHCDLAIKNIFIDENGVLVIGDFGLSEAVGEGGRFSKRTRSYYLAPELSEPERALMSKEADCCSAGLVALAIIISQKSYNLWLPNNVKSIRVGDSDCFKEDYLEFNPPGKDKIMLSQLYNTAQDLLEKHGDSVTEAYMAETEKFVSNVVFPLMERNPKLRATAKEVKTLVEGFLSSSD